MPTKLEELQTRRAAYVAAELKILESQEYQVGHGGGQRRNVRAELEQVRAGIAQLDIDIDAETARSVGGRRMYTAVPGRL